MTKIGSPMAGASGLGRGAAVIGATDTSWAGTARELAARPRRPVIYFEGRRSSTTQDPAKTPAAATAGLGNVAKWGLSTADGDLFPWADRGRTGTDDLRRRVRT